MSERFTIDGSDALEQHLDRVCEQVLAGVRDLVPPEPLEALLLGGGYGRGEGGVLRTPSGDRPYNDLEFYVFLRGSIWWNERRFGESLRWLAERLTPEAGAEVEFKITSLRALQSSPVSMFTYDLMMGHRCLFGREWLLAGSEHHCLASRIPLAEATRLLMNRCSGLLFAAERLARDSFTAEDADFAGRNLAKAQLGFGDAVLAAAGHYHWSCRKRHQWLRHFSLKDEPPWLPAVQRHHVAGLRFKLNPHRSEGPRDAFISVHEELKKLGLQVWLWIESQRLGVPFRSALEYAEHPSDKCPENAAWHNVLANGKAFGPAALFMEPVWRYPRERLLRSLALLLWERDAVTDPALRRRVRRALRTDATTFPDFVAAYERLWKRFN